MSFVEGVVADDAVKISGNYTSLEFLQAAYRCEELSLHVRMRAAMAALPFEYPKLAVTVQTTPQDFAARLDAAIARFAAMDEAGVLDYVSPQYRTGTLTKAGIAEQLRAVFAIHDQVRARVRIDDVRIVGGLAWVYSTGDVTGRLRWVGGTVPVLSWQRELEVARRESGRWRLFGYQQ